MAYIYLLSIVSAMEIRAATEEDIPSIVNLLKHSLGESLMPKSEAFWRWKHLENPFGPSPVLVCFEGADLIGVRAFMRWEWTSQGVVYKAVRAVDTATHPKHQGKGIFKKLTLSLVALCKAEDHFVFNTPNSQSKPGYLKMGWVEAGRLPIKFSIKKPLSIVRNAISKRSPLPIHEDSSVAKCFQHPNFDLLLEKQDHNTITTKTSLSYLRWRYSQVPVANYLAITDETSSSLNGVIICRIKQTRYGRELRITDHFSTSQVNKKELMNKLSFCTKQWKIDFITRSATSGGLGEGLFSGLYFHADAGPMVTIRELQLTDLGNFMKFNKWSPSLGDLELF